MQALQEVIDFCAAEQGRKNVLSVPLPLVRLMGSAEGGLFVAQLLAWSGKTDDWLAVSAAGWAAATALPASRVRALMWRCAALGILDVRAGPPGSESGREVRLLRGPLLRLLLGLLCGEQPPRPGARRARRRVRLPVQAEPEAWRESPAHHGKRVHARLAATTPLPALRPVRANGRSVQAARLGAWPAPILVMPDGAGRAHDGAAPRRPDAQAARNGANAAAKGRAARRQPDAPFDALRWQAALGELARRVPPDAYARWLDGSRFAAVEGGRVVVIVDDMNTAWWLNTRLVRVVERAVNLVAPGSAWLQVEARVS